MHIGPFLSPGIKVVRIEKFEIVGYQYTRYLPLTPSEDLIGNRTII
jgi:hypothetical protein